MISQPTRLVRLALLVAVTTGVAACASQEPVRGSTGQSSKPAVRTQHRSTVGERAAAVALQQVGVPYRYGGSSPAGFDCSGLVHFSYASVGLRIPRTTTGLWESLAPVDARQMRTGDLLFFNIEGKMSHVGMYLGGSRFVHAPSSGRKVSVGSLDAPYYRTAFIRGGRPR